VQVAVQGVRGYSCTAAARLQTTPWSAKGGCSAGGDGDRRQPQRHHPTAAGRRAESCQSDGGAQSRPREGRRSLNYPSSVEADPRPVCLSGPTKLLRRSPPLHPTDVVLELRGIHLPWRRSAAANRCRSGCGNVRLRTCAPPSSFVAWCPKVMTRRSGELSGWSRTVPTGRVEDASKKAADEPSSCPDTPPRSSAARRRSGALLCRLWLRLLRRCLLVRCLTVWSRRRSGLMTWRRLLGSVRQRDSGGAVRRRSSQA